MRASTSRGVEAQSLDQALVRRVLSLGGNPNIAVRLWNGEEFQITDGTPVACMEIRDRRVVFELLLSRSVGFGECYSQGRIEVEGSMRAFIVELSRAFRQLDRGSYYGPKLRSFLHAARVNSMPQSRQNVHHHYDLGNDFYKLWLDERMVYTCAYFERTEATLASGDFLLSDRESNARGGAAEQARPCLPQAAAAAGAKGGRGRLRLGCVGAAHGRALWRRRHCLQQLARAGSVREAAGCLCGPLRSGNVRRGRLPHDQ